MGRKCDSAGAEVSATPKRVATRVLLFSKDDELRSHVHAALSDKRRLELTRTHSLRGASRDATGRRFDLIVVDATLADDHAQVLRQLNARRRGAATLVVNHCGDFEQARQAFGAGAIDVLRAPLQPDQLRGSLRKALQQHEQRRRRARQVRRLRRLCHKLNEARSLVSQQVDILCSDLVSAYQELAVQVQQVMQSTEYSVLMREELDVEAVLRKTLEFLVEKAGPVNAAIFLPTTADEFSLGGYVNYDCADGSASVLLEHLADVLAPRVSGCDELLHITDDESLYEWIGDDAAYLAERHLLAVPAVHDGETLAVVTLFRDASAPFDDQAIEACMAVSPLLGQTLARVIRVYHRI